MQQVTFLHSKNGTSAICDDAQASIFASWYNKHNTKDEKRDRFSVMCLLNRSEASRFAACTYGIMIAGRFANKLSGKTNVGKGLAPSESNLSQATAGASPRPTDKPGATASKNIAFASVAS